MRLLQFSLLGGQTLFILGGKLLEVQDLVFELGDGGLEGGFLQGLGLLIGIDLLFGDKLVQRFTLVLGDDGVDFGGRIQLLDSVAQAPITESLLALRNAKSDVIRTYRWRSLKYGLSMLSTPLVTAVMSEPGPLVCFSFSEETSDGMWLGLTGAIALMCVCGRVGV